MARKLNRPRGFLAAATLAVCTAFGGAQAQDVPTLLADSIRVDDAGRLIAEGHVQVFYDGTALSAATVIYDRENEQLSLTGPILIQQPDGTAITAEAGQLDQRLRAGLLEGARMVLNQQLQLAASEIEQNGQGITQLTRVAATSCQVCGDSTPLWQIRAGRVVHDDVAQQIWFENATFLIKGVPLAWLPVLRVPAADVTRAQGLLAPRTWSTSEMGFGIMLPYYIPIGTSRDLTLTPYFAARGTAMLGQYRQALTFGDINVNAMVGSDQLIEGTTRHYIDATGNFRLSENTTLYFRWQDVSDSAVMSHYGYSYTDRLQSGVEISRIEEDTKSNFGFWGYRSLRDSETNDALPPYVAFARWEHDTTPSVIGGNLTYGIDYRGLWRTGDYTGQLGRDVNRLYVFGEWNKTLTLDGGARLRFDAANTVLAYGINDDPTYDDILLRMQPAIAATLSWPLIRADNAGRTQYLEPIISVGWSEGYGPAAPNEDSLIAEMDSANIFALSRLPGDDAVEPGARLGYGLRYAMFDPSGWSGALTIGQILRQEEADGLAPTSGMTDKSNDILLEAELVLPGGLSMDARTLLEDDLSGFGKSEMRVNWNRDTLGLSAGYIHLPADLTEARETTISELTFDSSLKLDDTWSLASSIRYDIAAANMMRVGFDIGWQNECVMVDLSVERRYTSTLYLEPSTSVGLSVSLAGFSVGGTRRASTACGI